MRIFLVAGVLLVLAGCGAAVAGPDDVPPPPSAQATCPAAPQALATFPLEDPSARTFDGFVTRLRGFTGPCERRVFLGDCQERPFRLVQVDDAEGRRTTYLYYQDLLAGASVFRIDPRCEEDTAWFGTPLPCRPTNGVVGFCVGTSRQDAMTSTFKRKDT